MSTCPISGKRKHISAAQDLPVLNRVTVGLKVFGKHRQGEVLMEGLGFSGAMGLDGFWMVPGWF